MVASSLAFATDALPPASQVSVLLKILSYDRNLAHRAGGDVAVGVVFKDSSSRSADCDAEIASALVRVGAQVTVAGKPVRVVKLPYSTPAKLEDDVRREHVAAAYVCPGLDAEIGAIASVARSRAALSFSANENYVREGLSVGLLVRDDHPQILVNLTSSRAEGADLSSDLLRIADVMR